MLVARVPINDRPIDRNMTQNRLSKVAAPSLDAMPSGAIITRGRRLDRFSFSNVKVEEKEKERRTRARLAFWTGPRGRAYCTIVADSPR